MKKLLILLLTLTACSDLLWAQATNDGSQIDIHTRCVNPIDTLSSTDVPYTACIRPITSSIEAHLGTASVRNTYLTPLLYTGQDLGITYERARRWQDLGWMSQQRLSGQFCTGEDQGHHSENWSGRMRYSYAALYTLDLYYLALMAGPYASAEAGFDYNLKMASSNNPATARITANAGLSAMAAFHYNLLGRRHKAALQLQTPLVGYAFMPEYGASYYETFLLQNADNQLHLTSLHNQQDFDLRLFTDVSLHPTRGHQLRVGVAWHTETMHINEVRTRLTTFEAIVGLTLQSIPYRSNRQSALKQTAYEAY